MFSGEEIEMGIRPEHVKLNMNPIDNESIPATIYVLEPMGRDVIYNVKVGKDIVKVITEEKMNLKPGDQVYLNMDREKYHLFDKTSGRNILLSLRSE